MTASFIAQKVKKYSLSGQVLFPGGIVFHEETAGVPLIKLQVIRILGPMKYQIFQR
jgi:hypothetical protein